MDKQTLHYQNWADCLGPFASSRSSRSRTLHFPPTPKALLKHFPAHHQSSILISFCECRPIRDHQPRMVFWPCHCRVPKWNLLACCAEVQFPLRQVKYGGSQCLDHDMGKLRCIRIVATSGPYLSAVTWPSNQPFACLVICSIIHLSSWFSFGGQAHFGF